MSIRSSRPVRRPTRWRDDAWHSEREPIDYVGGAGLDDELDDDDDGRGDLPF